ncbi:hypothetical protein FLCH110379_05350 [Flavobacterium chungbukense]
MEELKTMLQLTYDNYKTEYNLYVNLYQDLPQESN